MSLPNTFEKERKWKNKNKKQSGELCGKVSPFSTSEGPLFFGFCSQQAIIHVSFCFALSSSFVFAFAFFCIFYFILFLIHLHHTVLFCSQLLFHFFSFFLFGYNINSFNSNSMILVLFSLYLFVNKIKWLVQHPYILDIIIILPNKLLFLINVIGWFMKIATSLILMKAQA